LANADVASTRVTSKKERVRDMHQTIAEMMNLSARACGE
jgi:hypothetical protein